MSNKCHSLILAALGHDIGRSCLDQGHSVCAWRSKCKYLGSLNSTKRSVHKALSWFHFEVNTERLFWIEMFTVKINPAASTKVLVKTQLSQLILLSQICPCLKPAKTSQAASETMTLFLYHVLQKGPIPHICHPYCFHWIWN